MNNSFLMTNSIVLGIMQFYARVAERQTRRSQKPLSKDVRVQIPPRAPLRMFKACFSASLFCFLVHSIRPFGMQTSVPRDDLPQRAIPESQKQKCGPNCNFFAITDCRRAPKHGFQHENAANRPRNGPIPLCKDKRGSVIAKKLQKRSNFCFRDGPNGRMSATNRSANETGPPTPCLQNQQKPTRPDQCWGKWEGFALLYEQPSQGKNNTE